MKNTRTIRTIVFNSLLVFIFLLSFIGSPSAFASTPVADVERNQESEPDQSTPLPVDGVSQSDGDQAADEQEFVPPEPLEANDIRRADTGARESDALPETAVVEAHQINTTTDVHLDRESIQTPGSIEAWQTIMSEGFEGIFPSSGWTVFDNDGSANGEYYWDDDDYLPYSGSWSAWPANGGANGLDPEFYYYPNGMDSWMVYGPFDLSDAIDAELLFYYWNQSEINFDYFGWYASTDGSNFHGYRLSGDTGGWSFENFDLTSVPTLGDVTGDSSVWIAFVFTSDGSIVDDGAFVDDIVLDKYVSDLQPNLFPYTPSGWDYPIVPSSVLGTNTVNDLYADLDTYIDWAVGNGGSADISQTFYTCLYFDGSEIQCWFTNGLNQGFYTWVEDWTLNLTPTQGWHTLQIITDVFNDVAESNEGDNQWQSDFYWDISSQPNLVPYVPSGWDYPIVPSSVTGTNTVNTLYADQDTYIDWAVINDGTANIPQTFYTCLYFDGSVVQCWFTSGLDVGWYAWVQDWILNLTPTQGWHTLLLITDVYNDVTESNENDNEWQNDFYWDISADCDAVLTAFDANYKGTSIRSANNAPPVLMPPHPDLLERARKGEVTLPDLVTNPALRYDRGIDQPADLPAPPQGQWNALAILVEFTDNPSQVGATYFDSLLFGTGFSTLPDYFSEVSYGILDIVTVNLPSSIGWCTMPETYAYYVDGNNGLGTYPQNAQRLAEDAVWIADPYIDFSNYDNDGDGWVDTVFIVHAGPGAEFTGSLNDIWSHSWGTFNDPFVDGVTVNGYTTEPEFWINPGDMTIGVYAHELGHAFGLPDLYDTDNSSEGVGDWSLMGGGSWNGTNGDSPAFLDAWSRAQLEFLTPVNVTSNMAGASIPQAETSQTVYRMWTDGVVGSEYFLVENRQQTGYDAALPAEGLLLWHIDDNMSGNNLECDQLNNWLCGDNHFLVALEQADGFWDLEHNSDRGDVGDPYPGSTNNRNFTFATVPNSSSYYSSADTEIGVTNISNSSSTMTADLAVSSVANYILDVGKTGEGSGTVTSSPPGIDCGPDCEESYPDGTIVTLTAVPDANSTFTGWSGACTGTGSCEVTMTSHKSVIANFNIIYRLLDVTKLGTGSGTVTSNPAGIDCGTDCFQYYEHGTFVTLTAVADPGSTFDGWGGPCSGTGTCQVSMTEDRFVTATFTGPEPEYLLTVSKIGTGNGTVTSSPPGIDCGIDCDEFYPEGTPVTLTAIADPGYTFAGWGGACSGTGTCEVTMTTDQFVTANFAGDGATLWIEPPEATLPVSTNITVDVMVSNVTNLYGIELELTFDPAIVEVVDYDTGTAGIQIQPGVCPSPDFVVQNEADNTTGTISYAATSLSPSPPCDDGGIIASITFHGLAEGFSPVHFNSWLLSDTDLNPIPVGSTADGMLDIIASGMLEGTVDVQGRSDESGAEICVWQGGAELGCTTTDTSGYYTFSLPADTYDVFVEMARYLDGEKMGQVVVAGGTSTLCQVKVLGGDANDDDVINILDLSFMGFRFGQSIGDPNWDERADINDDGTINILDIVGAGANFNETSPVPWPCP